MTFLRTQKTLEHCLICPSGHHWCTLLKILHIVFLMDLLINKLQCNMGYLESNYKLMYLQLHKNFVAFVKKNIFTYRPSSTWSQYSKTIVSFFSLIIISCNLWKRKGVRTKKSKISHVWVLQHSCLTVQDFTLPHTVTNCNIISIHASKLRKELNWNIVGGHFANTNSEFFIDTVGSWSLYSKSWKGT